MKVTIVPRPTDSSDIVGRVVQYAFHLNKFFYYPLLSTQKEALKAFIGKELEGEIVFSNGHRIHYDISNMPVNVNLYAYKEFIKITSDLSGEEKKTDKKGLEKGMMELIELAYFGISQMEEVDDLSSANKAKMARVDDFITEIMESEKLYTLSEVTERERKAFEAGKLRKTAREYINGTGLFYDTFEDYQQQKPLT